MKVTIYTINDCKFSQAEKEYLKKNNIAFEEKNLETNRDFLTEMLSISDNFAGTPVTQIEKDDGTKVVLKGFTEKEFATELGLQSSGETTEPKKEESGQEAPASATEPTTENKEPTAPVIESLSDSSSGMPTPSEESKPMSDNQTPTEPATETPTTNVSEPAPAEPMTPSEPEVTPEEPTTDSGQPTSDTQPPVPMPQGTTSPGPTQDNQIKPISLSDNSSMPTPVSSDTGPSPMPPSKINNMNNSMSQPMPNPAEAMTVTEAPAEDTPAAPESPAPTVAASEDGTNTPPPTKDLNSVLQNLESQVGTAEKKEDVPATAPSNPTTTDQPAS